MEPSQLSVRQWSVLAKNPVYATRKWAWDAFVSHEAMVKQNPVDALRILESPWDDSREFSINYFRDRFKDEDWNAELMIGVCDSVREDVQQFGRELLTRYFDEGQGEQILLKLSQHPSVNVQLFTSNYLTAYAANSLERIQELEHYYCFITR